MGSFRKIVTNEVKFSTQLCINKLNSCAKFELSSPLLADKKLPKIKNFREAYRALKKFSLFSRIIYLKLIVTGIEIHYGRNKLSE